jgi:hypothetical protein
MPAITPGYVKNMIRRSLRELVDPSPTKKEILQIWQYFDSECAYCGVSLNKSTKKGHIDHLISASQGGPNHKSNRVLSCADCNEKEKLDMDWNKFLAQKNNGNSKLQKRKEKILKWQEQNTTTELDLNIVNKIEAIGNSVCYFYDSKVKEIRVLV